MSTTFIQWKGTDLCMDFWCPECGAHSHFDGPFAYNIKCDFCGTFFEMPTDVPLKKLDRKPDGLVLFRDPDSLSLTHEPAD